jgi:hypothetical protein
MQPFGRLSVRCALTPPANPRECARLCATSTVARCVTPWLDAMRVDDPLRSTRIRRCDDARRW